ncbi:hypothetical protein C8R45DRAFT_934359 [Mycena sanguinolenta]|nr:hypothetical protein C8R45DRAFT_934359 [Mycena sanguinolenta]
MYFQCLILFNNALLTFELSGCGPSASNDTSIVADRLCSKFGVAELAMVEYKAGRADKRQSPLPRFCTKHQTKGNPVIFRKHNAKQRLRVGLGANAEWNTISRRILREDLWYGRTELKRPFSGKEGTYDVMFKYPQPITKRALGKIAWQDVIQVWPRTRSEGREEIRGQKQRSPKGILEHRTHTKDNAECFKAESKQMERGTVQKVADMVEAKQRQRKILKAIIRKSMITVMAEESEELQERNCVV